jgi:hypothetical protein
MAFLLELRLGSSWRRPTYSTSELSAALTAYSTNSCTKLVSDFLAIPLDPHPSFFPLFPLSIYEFLVCDFSFLLLSEFLFVAWSRSSEKEVEQSWKGRRIRAVREDPHPLPLKSRIGLTDEI